MCLLHAGALTFVSKGAVEQDASARVTQKVFGACLWPVACAHVGLQSALLAALKSRHK